MNKRKEKGNVNAKRESNFAFKFPYLISAALDKLASYAIILFLLLLFFFFYFYSICFSIMNYANTRFCRNIR